jgi:hypothetical protein
MKTTIPSTASSYISYNSASNKFVVNPTLQSQCGTTSFTYQLTDGSALVTTSYSMTVTITNSPPDFSSAPSLQPVATPYQLHVMKALTPIVVPTVKDPENLAIVVSFTETTIAGGI